MSRPPRSVLFTGYSQALDNPKFSKVVEVTGCKDNGSRYNLSPAGLVNGYYTPYDPSKPYTPGEPYVLKNDSDVILTINIKPKVDIVWNPARGFVEISGVEGPNARVNGSYLYKQHRHGFPEYQKDLETGDKLLLKYSWDENRWHVKDAAKQSSNSAYVKSTHTEVKNPWDVTLWYVFDPTTEAWKQQQVTTTNCCLPDLIICRETRQVRYPAKPYFGHQNKLPDINCILDDLESYTVVIYPIIAVK